MCTHTYTHTHTQIILIKFKKIILKNYNVSNLKQIFLKNNLNLSNFCKLYILILHVFKDIA